MNITFNITNTYIETQSCNYEQALKDCMAGSNNSLLIVAAVLFLIQLFIFIINKNKLMDFKYYDNKNNIHSVKEILYEINSIIVVILFFYLIFRKIFY